MKKISVLLSILVITALFSGCGKTIKTSDGSLTVNNGSVEVKDNEGNKTTISSSDSKKGGSLPEGYPKNLVPIIDDAVITAAVKSTQDNQVGYTIMYNTNKDQKAATDFYFNALKDLSNISSMESDDLSTITGDKDNYDIGVGITKCAEENAKATVSISIYPVKK